MEEQTEVIGMDAKTAKVQHGFNRLWFVPLIIVGLLFAYSYSNDINVSKAICTSLTNPTNTVAINEAQGVIAQNLCTPKISEQTNFLELLFAVTIFVPILYTTARKFIGK